MKIKRIMPIRAAVSLSVICLTACTPQKERNIQKKHVSPPAASRQEQLARGEQLFKQYCAACHPDGGNVSDPARNLRRSTLQANRITKPEDIIKIMRKPISRMIRFDAATLSDQDARAIADYVLETF